MRLRTLIAIMVTMCALPALAAELPTAPAPRAVPVRVTKVYCVADLVAYAKEKEGERLVKLVTSMVRPYSWEDAGGRGRVEYFNIGSALVVSNTSDVQQEVSDLLEALERLQKNAANKPQAHRLRNIEASEAARALTKRFEKEQLYAKVTFDAATNTVFVAGEAEALLLAGHILSALDFQPPQVILTTLVVGVPDDFVERCGLNVGSAPGATNWTLTARELQMFAQLLREGKGRGEIDVYTRPQIAVSDNQTGYAQVGQLFPLLEVGALVPAYANLGVTFRATPRVMPDGRILLRTEVQFGELVRTALTSTVPGIPFPVTHLGQQFNLRSLQTTAELKPGETLVARLGDKLVIITPTIVK